MFVSLILYAKHACKYKIIRVISLNSYTYVRVRADYYNYINYTYVPIAGGITYTYTVAIVKN